MKFDFVEEEVIRAEFAKYKNGMGLVDDSRALHGDNSGNSMLFHSHYLWTLKRRGFYKREDGVDFLVAVYQHCSVKPGLYQRAGKNFSFWQDIEQSDDYLGLISLCAFNDFMPFAKDFLEYGRTNWVAIGPAYPKEQAPWWIPLVTMAKVPFVFNAQKPETFLNRDGTGPEWVAWFGRFISMIALAKIVLGEPMNRFWTGVCHATLAVTIWLTARVGKDKHSEDPWILTEKVVSTLIEKKVESRLVKSAILNFYERLYAKWPNGMRGPFLPYFGEKHAVTRFYVDAQ